MSIGLRNPNQPMGFMQDLPFPEGRIVAGLDRFYVRSWDAAATALNLSIPLTTKRLTPSLTRALSKVGQPVIRIS